MFKPGDVIATDKLDGKRPSKGCDEHDNVVDFYTFKFGKGEVIELMHIKENGDWRVWNPTRKIFFDCAPEYF
jgi:hypothetical protein